MSLPRSDHVPKSQNEEPSNLPPRIKSSDLFQGQSRLVIVHKDSEYQLQITQHGKLILTK
jgi:hemin uptake protein HemP